MGEHKNGTLQQHPNLGPLPSYGFLQHQIDNKCDFEISLKSANAKYMYMRLMSIFLLPVGESVWVDTEATEEEHDHHADGAVQDVLPSVIGHHIVAGDQGVCWKQSWN